jgi:uncharacterized protein (DUF58 family)
MNRTEQKIPSIFSSPLMLCIVGLICFGALLGHQREPAVLALLVGGLMGAARLWTGFAPKGVACGLSVDRSRVYPGEPLALQATVANAKLLPVHFTLSLAPGDVVVPDPRQPGIEQSGGLLCHQQVRFRWVFTARKRGIHHLGPPELAVGDLLGYYRREIPSTSSLRIVVFPRLVPLKPVRLPRRDLFGETGGAGMLPDPLFIVGTRDYQEGRPARHIHWKASARRRGVQEKVYEPSFQEKLLLAVAVRGFAVTGDEGAFERTLEVVASLSVRMQGEGRPVGLATDAACPGGGPVILPPAGSARQLTVLMDTLAGMRMEPAGSLVTAVRTLAPLPWGMSCLLFCHGNDEEAASLRRALRGRRVPVALVLCGRRARGTPPEEVDGTRIHTLDDFHDMDFHDPDFHDRDSRDLHGENR